MGKLIFSEVKFNQWKIGEKKDFDRDICLLSSSPQSIPEDSGSLSSFLRSSVCRQCT